jgi:type IV pilus assembly protein PilB
VSNSFGIDPKVLLKKLFEMEEVEKAAAQEIYAKHRKQGVDIIQACVEGGIREDAVLYAVGALLGLETVQLTGIELPRPLIDMVPQNVASSYRIIPVRLEDDALVIATATPDNLSALDDLKFMLKVRHLRPALTSEKAIEEALAKYYPEKAESDVDKTSALQADLLKNYENEVEIDASSGMEVFNLDQLAGLDMGADIGAAAESAPVRKLLNLILLTAVKAQASDVHFEPFEATFRVRNRIDGVLYEMLPVPKTLAAPLVARIKVMGQLDIAERRMPQDGKISVKIGGREVDLRVSCLPTMFGESVVIRILDRNVVSLDIDKIGFPDEMLTRFKDIIQMPNGIVVVTGPTGSGKTTTLYSALSAVNEDSVKIITTEDPVEYEINGLIQVPIDDEIGKSFGVCLRAILRQDPDVLLVGEVRDAETAQIAIQASLTGHLVFTTLHTNDAPTAVTRLIDMGVEPFLLAATLETILAQRLVRTICVKCKTPYEPTEEELLTLGIKTRDVASQRFYYGKGCETCKNTGYKGRTAIFELMTVDDAIRALILGKSSSNQIRNVAQRNGMRTLRDSGVQKVYAGLTTIEEVVRETMAAEE